jgi:hypothetical protein
MIICYNIRNLNNLNIPILFAFYLALGSIAFTRAGAQQSPATENPTSTASSAPSSLVAHNTLVASSRAVAPSLPVDPNVRPTDKTKVLRIYGGAGYFDLALAEELRPTLAKALALQQIDPVKTVPRQVTVPLKADSQRKVPVAANL